MNLRWIAHIDLDCFFVSVERIHDPSLSGKPVVVGGSTSGRGVVASASYEARKFGVRSAMPTARALHLCPHLIVVGGRHGEYSRVSRELFVRMKAFAPVVERASIDEMYLDFTGCESLYNNNLPSLMKQLQQLVLEEFKLPSTISLASNKLVAKISANTVKPAGVIFVPHGTEAEFLAPLPVASIPGVGGKTEKVLHAHGLNVISDLQAKNEPELTKILGAHGEWLFRASRGMGSTEVSAEHDRKSVSEERTFAEDIAGLVELERRLFKLVEGVCSTLRSQKSRARTITLKLRWSDFTTLTRQVTTHPTNYDPEVYSVARRLLRTLADGRRKVRLLGIAASHLIQDDDIGTELFPLGERKQDRIAIAADRIRDKFGDDAIRIGGI